jgi:hypothetical protein
MGFHEAKTGVECGSWVNDVVTFNIGSIMVTCLNFLEETDESLNTDRGHVITLLIGIKEAVEFIVQTIALNRSLTPQKPCFLKDFEHFPGSKRVIFAASL